MRSMEIRNEKEDVRRLMNRRALRLHTHTVQPFFSKQRIRGEDIETEDGRFLYEQE